MDLTPYLGIIGACLGAGITLIVQRVNRSEQRRKDLIHLAVELLRATDALVAGASTAARRPVDASGRPVPETLSEVREVVRKTTPEIRHQLQYIELAANAMMHKRAACLAESATSVLGAAMDLWLAAEDLDALGKRYVSANDGYADERELFKSFVRANPDSWVTLILGWIGDAVRTRRLARTRS